jgi:hypothetical protein
MLGRASPLLGAHYFQRAVLALLLPSFLFVLSAFVVF